MAVVLHPGADVIGAERLHDHYIHNYVGNPTDSTVAAASLLFTGVLTRHEDLRIALLHGGGFSALSDWSIRPRVVGSR